VGRITTCIPIIVAVHAPSLETHPILHRHTSSNASDLTPPGIYDKYFRLIRGRAKKSGVAQLRALRSLSSEVSKAFGAQRHGFGLDLFQHPGLSWGQKAHGTRRQKWKLRTARPRAANKLPSNHASIDGTSGKQPTSNDASTNTSVDATTDDTSTSPNRGPTSYKNRQSTDYTNPIVKKAWLEGETMTTFDGAKAIMIMPCGIPWPWPRSSRWTI